MFWILGPDYRYGLQNFLPFRELSFTFLMEAQMGLLLTKSRFFFFFSFCLYVWCFISFCCLIQCYILDLDACFL